jgi:hypothetical protein
LWDDDTAWAIGLVIGLDFAAAALAVVIMGVAAAGAANAAHHWFIG